MENFETEISSANNNFGCKTKKDIVASKQILNNFVEGNCKPWNTSKHLRLPLMRN